MKNEAVVNKVKSHNPKYKSDQYQKNKMATCKFCGRQHPFKRDACPAFGKSCSVCHKMNHFAAVCTMNSAQPRSTHRAAGLSRNSKVKNVHNMKQDGGNVTDSDDSNAEWINSMSSEQHIKSKQVFCKMQVHKQDVKFQIDSGSSINIIPRKFLGSNDVIKQSQTNLVSWTNRSSCISS